MKRTGGPANPLALAVLVLLFERPMHPYEIGATLKMRRMEKSIKFRYGSLYTVIEGLQKEGWIAAKETVRDGRRPERTVYEITPDGLTRMRTGLREMLGSPVKEYPQFEAALSFLPAIPPAEAVTLLEGRLRRLGAIAEEIRAVVEVVSKAVEPLFLVENEYRLAIVEAERQFIDGLLRRIADDERYTRAWKGFHQADPERDKSAPNARAATVVAAASLGRPRHSQGVSLMKLNHLNLSVPSVSETREFFETYFGFRCVLNRGRDTLAVLLGDDGFVLALSNFDKVTEVQYPGAFHIGFMQVSRERVDEMYERLKSSGFTAEPPREFHGAWTFYLRAPGGFVVEVGYQHN